MLFRRLIIVMLALPFAAANIGCGGASLRRFEYTRLCMGVKTRIVLYAHNDSTASDAASAAFDRIGQLDACMSDYRRDSELNRLCDHAGSEPVNVSDDLFDVIATSLSVSRASDGAFDVSIAPVVALWRKARMTNALPDPQKLSEARELVDWRGIALDESNHTVELLKPGMRLDLGGIGKGYAAQQAIDVLKARGVNRCLVALAGDIAVGDPPPDARGWTIDIALPKTARSLLLSNAAVSTSGDAEQFTEVAGVRYSHIVDPRTGIGVTNQRQVTVIAPRGEIADAVSSAACVVEADRLDCLIEQFPGAAAIVWDPNSTEAGQRIAVIDPSRRIHWRPEGGSP
jgi:thiamine biosynthesis lipoprotein